ncbi:hypothetical protein NQ314_004704 [Rhamnusium bicolor]|uniref:acylphosphatase n=1 Tax=Rhamnusium bicolor TaxID=1586634 RepID=A0AAV8ZKN4_9CUCU|nr:hypothetical protein NQ314_004704 [Rhamnusium bicolor]
MFVYIVYQLFRVTEFLYIFAVFTILSWVFLTFDIAEMTSNEKLVSVDFEVFGKVQGVFFRKYTEQQANRLGLKGWCMNTHQDTVKGVVEGTPSKVNEMLVQIMLLI